MKAVLIPSPQPYFLSPLCTRTNINSLPIFGTSLLNITEQYLNKNHIESFSEYENVTKSDLLSDDGLLILFQENILTSLDLSLVINAHIKTQSEITVVLTSDTRTKGASVNDFYVSLNQNGYVASVSDSGTNGFSYAPVGIYIIDTKSISLDFLFSDSLNMQDIVSRTLTEKQPIYGLVFNDVPFISIHNQSDYIQCHRLIMNKNIDCFIPNSSVREVSAGLFSEGDAEISDGVLIEPPVFISSGCKIHSSVKLSGTFIGKNTVIEKGGEILNSVIGESCVIGGFSSIDGGILCDNINLGKKCSVNTNTIIGSSCRIGDGCKIEKCVRIWNNKRIEENTRVCESIIHTSLARERIFQNGRIDGEINIDITPEFMSKLGAALGTLMPKSKIAVCSASSSVCNILASAASAGIASVGSTVLTFGEQPLSLFRCGIIYHKPNLGLYISQSDDRDVFYPEITVLSSNGANIGECFERILEDACFGGIFPRSAPDKIRRKISLESFRSKYVQDILNSVKSKAFYKNTEIRTKSECISEILGQILTELEPKTEMGSVKEFKVDIAQDGQKFELYTPENRRIDNQTRLAICTKLYCEYFNISQIVLPVSVSSRIKSIPVGVGIIECSVTDYDFIKSILGHNLVEQYRTFFDGIFFSIILLDYLNLNKISFSEFIKDIPSFDISEEEVECPEIRKGDILKKLCEKYKGESTPLANGMKIYQSNGWVLIIPEKYRHCIKVITEGYTTEAADEISAIFTNQIKKLAKPN